MDDRLARLYQGVAVHATADREHRAALELLALVMLSDADIGDDEVEVLREISTEWREEAFTFEHYLRPGDRAVRGVPSRANGRRVPRPHRRRISSRVLRKALFSAARDIAGVDDDVTPDENTLLAEVAVRFG